MNVMYNAIKANDKSNIEDIKKISSFAFSKWLSGNAYTINFGNLFNYYSDIPVDVQYKMVNQTFAGKIKYIPYIKIEKDDKTKQDYIIATHYNIGIEKTKEFSSFMSEDEINYLNDLYKDFHLKNNQLVHINTN